MADPQETQVNSLVINKLTKTQYQALVDAGTVSSTELYLVPDDGSTVAAWGNITGTLSNQTDLQSALDAKQATLTAGSNIQIVDNTISATDTTYTAGTGISIENNVISNTQTSAAWGNITGTLSNQTDLQNALDAKQDTISNLSTIESNASAGKAASDTIATYGDVVTHNASEFYLSTNPEGYTSNIGTITGITMNGASKGTSGVVDLGTVVTDVSEYTADEVNTLWESL